MWTSCGRTKCFSSSWLQPPRPRHHSGWGRTCFNLIHSDITKARMKKRCSIIVRNDVTSRVTDSYRFIWQHKGIFLFHFWLFSFSILRCFCCLDVSCVWINCLCGLMFANRQIYILETLLKRDLIIRYFTKRRKEICSSAPVDLINYHITSCLLKYTLTL